MLPDKKRNVFITIAAFIILTFMAVLIIIPSKKKNNKKHPVTTTTNNEPVFRKDGELTFVHNNKTLHTISIEIADDDAERTQGLMYRQGMPDSCGMLFIFEEMQPLSFWMKNTRFSLDIIYVNKDFRIVSIAENTVPFSEMSIPSGKDAMYVVEVNAGFCENKSIVVGNKITFTLK